MCVCYNYDPNKDSTTWWYIQLCNESSRLPVHKCFNDTSQLIHIICITLLPTHHHHHHQSFLLGVEPHWINMHSCCIGISTMFSFMQRISGFLLRSLWEMVYFDQIKVRVPAISALSMMSGGTRVSRPRKNKPVVAMSRCTAANRKYKHVSAVRSSSAMRRGQKSGKPRPSYCPCLCVRENVRIKFLENVLELGNSEHCCPLVVELQISKILVGGGSETLQPRSHLQIIEVTWYCAFFLFFLSFFDDYPNVRREGYSLDSGASLGLKQIWCKMTWCWNIWERILGTGYVFLSMTIIKFNKILSNVMFGLIRSRHLCSQSALKGKASLKGTRREAN